MTLNGSSTDLEVAELASSGLFDHGWYIETYEDVRSAGLDPILHWYKFGAREFRNPNYHFQTLFYLSENRDVAAAGLNPLLHYLRHGEQEGRKPARHFDPSWYRIAYSIPDHQPALRHFLQFRTARRFAPCPELFSLPFLIRSREKHLDEATDLFANALDKAAQEGRPLTPDVDLIAESGLLDTNYYLVNGSDVYDAHLDSVQHFCRFGWMEERRPNIYFDTGWYLRTNPRVPRMHINPLVHYIVEGERGGRRPVVYFDPVWYREQYHLDNNCNALAHYLANRRRQTYSPNPIFDVSWYIQHLDAELGPNRDPFAHYLQAGTLRDINPSPNFDAAGYRRTHLGRPSRVFRQLMNPERYNPLVHYLMARYR